MANFGPANYGKSKQQKHPILIHDSTIYPGKRYEFYRNSSYMHSDGVETVYYNCIGCKKNKVAKLPRVSVRNGQLLTNPEAPDNIAHDCTPFDIAKSEAAQLDREIRADIKDGMKTPRDAFREAEEKIHEKFARYDEFTRTAIEQNFPDYKVVRRSYNKIARRCKLQNLQDGKLPPCSLAIKKRNSHEADSFFGKSEFVNVRAGGAEKLNQSGNTKHELKDSKRIKLSLDRTPDKQSSSRMNEIEKLKIENEQLREANSELVKRSQYVHLQLNDRTGVGSVMDECAVNKIVNRWNVKDCSECLRLFADRQTVVFWRGQNSWHSVRATHGIIFHENLTQICYFEMEIVEQTDCITIGFADEKMPLIGYPNTNNAILLWQRHVKPNGNYDQKDVIGCGLIIRGAISEEGSQQSQLFITEKGKITTNKAISMPPNLSNVELFPFVCMAAEGTQLKANFGQMPFLYDLTKHEMADAKGE